jgi:hypothetical protein
MIPLNLVCCCAESARRALGNIMIGTCSFQTSGILPITTPSTPSKWVIDCHHHIFHIFVL